MKYILCLLLLFIGRNLAEQAVNTDSKLDVLENSFKLQSVATPAKNGSNASIPSSHRVSPSISSETLSSQIDSRPEFLSFNEWNKEKLRQKKAVHQDRPQRLKFDNSNSGEMIRDELDMDFEIFNEEEPEGKVYKDKFNYASVDCAATVIKTNSEAQGATSILFENKDKSLLNPCSVSNKFVVIELCEDILVESIVMANFEFFSSTFKTVRFSVAERFPVPKNGWKVLGEFEAENLRNTQEFKIPNPMIWARYLRIEVLSHYGDEFYCPITLIRAHGIAMIDEFKMEVQYSGAELEEMIPIDHVSAIEKEKCMIPKSFATNNMSINFDLDFNYQCLASLKHMDFDEFFAGHRNNENITRIKETSASMPINTEESIFKNIMKRLSGLETNMTMSILYIEEQSKLLSRSFDELELSYAQKFEALINVFNETMNMNLENLNQFASQLRESSLKIVEEQKLTTDKFLTTTMKKVDDLETAYRQQSKVLYLILFGLITLIIYISLTRESYFEDHMVDDGWYSEGSSLTKLKKNIKRSVSENSHGLSFEVSTYSPISSDSDFDDDDSVIISNK